MAKEPSLHGSLNASNYFRIYAAPDKAPLLPLLHPKSFILLVNVLLLVPFSVVFISISARALRPSTLHHARLAYAIVAITMINLQTDIASIDLFVRSRILGHCDKARILASPVRPIRRVQRGVHGISLVGKSVKELHIETL